MAKRFVPDDHKYGSKAVWEDVWTNLPPEARKYYSEGDETNYLKYWTWLQNRFIEKRLPTGRGLKLLECGCGRGDVSLFFAKRGYEVHLLDQSVGALNLAHENFVSENEHAYLYRADVLKLPFRSRTVDVVISLGLLEHFEDVTQVMAEMTRVLKPGGVFFAAILTKRFCVQSLVNLPVNLPISLMKGVIEALKNRDFVRIRMWVKRMKDTKRIAAPAYYENSYTKEQYLEYMTAAGLNNVEIIGTNPFPTIDIFNSSTLLSRLYVLFTKITLKIRNLFLRRDPWICASWWARTWLAFGHKRKV